MRHIDVRKRRPSQAKAKPAPKDDPGVGVPSAGATDRPVPGETQDDIGQIPNEPSKSPGKARSEAAAIKEQFYDNDSLGG